MSDDTHKPVEIHDANDLAAYLRSHKGPEYLVSTTLKTDERVIARVTDGIYRQPGSALRELIVNAYDADATRVIIKTDPPRFERIEVTDDGMGMSPEVLAHLLFHIGGSAKRHEDGRTLGVTANEDSLFSPKGRRLIGKIGIGLFSISQLTRSFQIITKIAGDPHRTIATVVLKQYADEGGELLDGDQHKYESGKVNLWREPASDSEAHGTTIVLTNIRPQAKDTLRSREIWEALRQQADTTAPGEKRSLEPPRFHIGATDESGDVLIRTGADNSSLPWNSEDEPARAFKKLVDSVWDEIGQSSPNPSLESIFDYYLRMVWQLSLSIPLPYVDGHLFDKTVKDWAKTFLLSNKRKGQAEHIALKAGESLRDQFGLSESHAPEHFEVYFDSLQLFRPLKYESLPTTSHAIKYPLIFIGKHRETFPSVSKELSGGPLAFEAYLFWAPKIAPVEHQGALVRIHGASGTLFDPSFMRYPISEQTRLRQITCEIFVYEGLDSALNIDRESFNAAHPHAVYLTRWLHAALRQLANAQKKLAKDIRDSARAEIKSATVDAIQRIAADVWSQEVDDASEPPGVQFEPERTQEPVQEPAERRDVYSYRAKAVFSGFEKPTTQKAKQRHALLQKKLQAIVQVLVSYGLLEDLNRSRQEQLLKAIYEILEVQGE